MRRGRYPYRTLATLPRRRPSLAALLCATAACVCWAGVVVVSAVAVLAALAHATGLSAILVIYASALSLGGWLLTLVSRQE